jgi:hypothetical protein
MMIDHVLETAATWTHWDGTPVTVDVDGEQEPRIYTPHKAIRRISDHLVDHLAQIQAYAAGRSPLPDNWHGSMITTPADLTVFSDADLVEANCRLGRLAQLWDICLRSLNDTQLDSAPSQGWSPREIAAHVIESSFYADTIGPLTTA